jgi:hypothetical protein
VKTLILLSVLLCSLGLSACAGKAQKQEVLPTENSVWVWKPDGSKSCGFKEGISPDGAAQELQKAGIRVLAKRKSTDGMMHVEMCGAATGDTVEMEVPASQLKQVISKGYKLRKQAKN